MTATLPTNNREIRVDFFRGIAMLIIFVAHMPGNYWALWIPARFGASDGAEMFVFCSGYASAIAFGGVFARRGFAIGISRIAYRVWQVYWAHIGLFLVVSLVCVAGTSFLEYEDYVGTLNLYKFFDNPQAGLLHLFTLTYVPNFFDILPMYIVVLMLVPVMVALQRIHTAAFIAGAFAIWLAAPHIALPAEWWSERRWFFNPFGWQLIFFTGFAFGARWLRPPKPDWRLVTVCLVFVVLLIPISWYKMYNHAGLNAEVANLLGVTLKEMREVFTGSNIQFGIRKMNFGIVRWLHFLALAYLMYCLFATREHWLTTRWVRPIVQVGQQSLAVFLFSMALAWVGTMVLDTLGRNAFTLPLVNLGAFCLLWFVARTAAYFKSSPWRTRRTPAASSTASTGGVAQEPSAGGAAQETPPSDALPPAAARSTRPRAVTPGSAAPVLPA